MEEKQNQKKKVSILVLVLGLVLLTIGGTYAFFTYTRQGQQENTLTTGRLYFIYDELSDIPSNSIAIQNAYPMSDEEGKLQEGQGMFEFQVRATTKGSAINYEVYLTKDDATSTLDEKTVNTYFSSVPTKGGEIGTESPIENEWTQKEVNQYNKLWISQEPPVIEEGNGKTLLQDTIPDNQTDYTNTYRYRMWVNENASGVDEEGNWIYGGKTFTVRVNVYASNEQLPPPLEPQNDLDNAAIMKTWGDFYGTHPEDEHLFPNQVYSEEDFHNSEYRESITKITFETGVTSEPSNYSQKWDISDSTSENKVYAYLLDSPDYEVVIQTSVDKLYLNPNSNFMFSFFTNLKEIVGFDKVDASKVEKTGGMFFACSELTEVDLSSWDISNLKEVVTSLMVQDIILESDDYEMDFTMFASESINVYVKDEITKQYFIDNATEMGFDYPNNSIEVKSK